MLKTDFFLEAQLNDVQENRGLTGKQFYILYNRR